jgi:hypothetical protein
LPLPGALTRLHGAWANEAEALQAKAPKRFKDFWRDFSAFAPPKIGH